MATIVGTITPSHVPAIGGAIAKGLQSDPYWKPFFDGFPPVREWLARVKPDVIVVVYNDHGLNFFLDKMPTFAISAAFEYRSVDERLVSFLLITAERFGSQTADGLLIDVPLKHQDIASSINASRETTGRAITRLEKKGLITNRQTRFILHDVKKLQSYL